MGVAEHLVSHNTSQYILFDRENRGMNLQWTYIVDLAIPELPSFRHIHMVPIDIN